MPELPDWTRGFALLGKYGDDYIALATTADGQLYIVAIGQDGEGNAVVLRTNESGALVINIESDEGMPINVDGYGHIRMTPYGFTQEGSPGHLRIDTDGQLIMVPRGADGNYMAVDADGFLGAVIRGEEEDETLHVLRVDGDGQIVMVPRGSSGYYLDVDASGFMTTVIKGNYDGELITVRADAQGRLSAFIIDSVDAWGNMLAVGNAELAARMGSPVRFDQRGRVQFMESFEYGLARWTITGSGTGHAVALTPTTFNTGGYSCALTGGSDTSRAAIITWVGGPQITGNIGIEFSFSQEASIEAIDTVLDVRDGVDAHYIGIRYDDANNKLQYYDDGGDWADIAAVSATNTNVKTFNHMKIVANLDTGYYVRAQFNDAEYDISAYAIRSYASAGSPDTAVVIRVYSLSGYNQTAYVDDVILTNAEPA